MAAIDGKKDLDQRERLGVLWANIKRRYGGDKKPISLEPLIASDGVFVRITRAPGIESQQAWEEHRDGILQSIALLATSRPQESPRATQSCVYPLLYI